MPEDENEESAESAETGGRGKGEDGPARSLADRADRALKDVDRMIKKSPETPPEQKIMAQLEGAKVSAMLELADAIRSKK